MRTKKPKAVAHCPNCEHGLTYDEIKSLWGKATQSRRTTYGAGSGRPKLEDRCPCGKMGKERAALRRHVCTPEMAVK